MIAEQETMVAKSETNYSTTTGRNGMTGERGKKIRGECMTTVTPLPLYNYTKHHDLSGYDQTFIHLQRYCFLTLCAIPKNDDLVSDELGTRRRPGAVLTWTA